MVMGYRGIRVHGRRAPILGGLSPHVRLTLSCRLLLFSPKEGDKLSTSQPGPRARGFCQAPQCGPRAQPMCPSSRLPPVQCGRQGRGSSQRWRSQGTHCPLPSQRGPRFAPPVDLSGTSAECQHRVPAAPVPACVLAGGTVNCVGADFVGLLVFGLFNVTVSDQHLQSFKYIKAKVHTPWPRPLLLRSGPRCGFSPCQPSGVPRLGTAGNSSHNP